MGKKSTLEHERCQRYFAHCEKCARCKKAGPGKNFWNKRSWMCPVGWLLFIAWYGEREYEAATAMARRKIVSASD